MEKNTNDILILKLQRQIADKKKSLANVKRFSPITNMSLELFGQRYNLNVIDTNTILFIKGLLLSIQANVEQTIVVSGFTISDWLSDLDNRYTILNVKTEESKLKTMEDKLSKLLSKEAQAEIEIAKIMSELNA